MISETLSISVSNCVIPPLFYAVNQLADIFAWQFRINGLPIPAITCPTMTHQNELFTNSLRPVPSRQRALPIAMPTFVPYVSIA